MPFVAFVCGESMFFVLAAVLLLASGRFSPATAAQQPPAATQQPPAAGQPPTQPPPTAPALAAREFTAPVGMILNTVRPERVADFERFIAYLQAALEKATDPTTAAQAKGWRVFRATEPGPNGTVLYVFLLDPTVAKTDYGLGRILADAYPNPVQLQEIWKLYQSSVTSGGSLLNLAPSHPVLTPAGATPGTPVTPAGPDAAPTDPPRTPPADANPNLK
jgi:hypothetical protein